MKHEPILMEDYFSPGFKTKPAVHVGSQTLSFFEGNIEYQAWEGVHLAITNNNDLAVVRNMETDYLHYWDKLMGKTNVINLNDTDRSKYLAQVIVENKKYIQLIKSQMAEDATLMVFFPTLLEQELAKKLGIRLHGLPAISDTYGTKSGIRKLANEKNIRMAPGFICTSYKQAQRAVNVLKKSFDDIVIKHDFSVSGFYSKKITVKDLKNVRKEVDDLTGHPFIEGKDVFVIEGWLKSKASLCAHIEITAGHEPIICAGWQQIIDTDGISYLGGGPIMLSKKALKSFLIQVNKVAKALKEKGAIGSFGPDFLITADDEKSVDADTCILIELNARVPYTAFPLEIVKQVKGTIGSGFYAKHVKIAKPVPFKILHQALEKEGLLIKKKNKKAKGVVPYNTGLLPWGMFDIVAMADSWTETIQIVKKIEGLII